VGILKDLFGDLTSFSQGKVEKVNGVDYVVSGDFHGLTSESPLLIPSFGGSIRPNGSYNPEFVKIVRDLRDYAKLISIPIFAQSHVAHFLQKEGIDPIFSVGEKVFGVGTITLGYNGNEYYSTEQFFDAALGWAKSMNFQISPVAMSAHPAHAHRSKNILEEMTKEEACCFVPKDVSWPSRDHTQMQVRGPIRWSLHEIPTRIHHKVKGII